MAIIQLTENEMPIDLLRGEVARPIRRVGRIKRHLDPVKPARIPFRLTVRICRQIRPDNHVAAAAEKLGVVPGRLGVAARIVLADEAGRDALVLLDHLPLRLLAAVSVEHALRRDLLQLARVLQPGRRRRLRQAVAP